MDFENLELVFKECFFFRKAFCENFSNIFQSELEVVNY